jgi:hypothetical protein
MIVDGKPFGDFGHRAVGADTFSGLWIGTGGGTFLKAGELYSSGSVGRTLTRRPL